MGTAFLFGRFLEPSDRVNDVALMRDDVAAR